MLVAFVTAATTGEIPVRVYVIPEPGAGEVTVIVPVAMEQVGWAVTLAVGAAVAEFIVIVPVVVVFPHPPERVMVYGNGPVAIGVPLIVTTLDDQLPVTPAGKPETLAPVAPVVP